jgi:hypothetical protein
VRTAAFVVGLCIAAVGAVGILAPSILVALGQHFVTSGPFYVVAAVRVAVGLLLLSVAAVSRAPRALRVLGWVIVAVGITTALTGLLAIGEARAAIEWWSRQGPGLVRGTAVLLLALGGFVAYACSSHRLARAAGAVGHRTD